ncbi:MAG: hypothetical protein RSA06_04940 [Erysipelotrichaceae bacterium]
MGKVKKFIKENTIFVSLLSIIVLITLTLGGFYLMSQQNPATILSGLNDDSDKQDTNRKDKTYVENFYGDFNSDDSIVLNWSIFEYEKERITRVDLYHEKNLIANVTNLNSYQLMLNVYQYPTGKNSFTLQVNLENGKTVSKKIKVNIDEVFDTTFATENVDGGVLVKMNYKYGINKEVGIPNINLSDVKGNALDISYKETTIVAQDGTYVEAITSYFFNTANLKPGSYDYNVRFIFKKVPLSFDSHVNIVVKEVETPNTKPDVEDKEEGSKPDDNKPNETPNN